MKKIIWKNKSNGQLCVTIPKGSGMKDGDVVSIIKEKIRTIVYSYVTADLFHYGHLQLLQNANNLGDFHICGVITNEGIKSYKDEPIADLKERSAIVSSLRCVDMIMNQKGKDPTENLKKIYEQFGHAKIILVHSSNWDYIPGSEYIKEIGGEVIRPPFYEKLSTKNVIDKILKNHQKEAKEEVK